MEKNTKLLGIHVATGLKSNHRIIVIRNCKDLDVIQSSFTPAHMCSLKYFASFYGLRKINIIINSLGSERALWFGVRQDTLSHLVLKSMNIFLLIENKHFFPEYWFFFKWQGFLKLCFQLVQEVISHYHILLFIRHILQTSTHNPSFPSFIGTADTWGLR